MSHKEESSFNRIPAEKVLPDNSNLFRHSRELAKAMKRERFKPADPAAYNEYCEAAGIYGSSSPFDGIEELFDLELFTSALKYPDDMIMRGLMLGMTQAEVAAHIGVCQATVSNRYAKLVVRLREFAQ